MNATREMQGDSVTEYQFFTPSTENMQNLVRILFEENWARVVVGPCIEGAVFEFRFTAPPKLSMLDGYLTVDPGGWHFHLCIAEHRDAPSPELARNRRVAKVALFESHGARCGSSWGVRLWNGFGEQMTTVFLPNPYYSDDFRRLKEPDWSRLKLWHDLRRMFLEVSN
jgi:hypothetical protein